jgi:hypothetical protein
MRTEIASYITGVALNNVVLNSVSTSKFALRVQCPAKIVLTGPTGAKSGVTSAGETLNAIPNTTLNFEDGVFDVLITDPVSGAYTLTLDGAQSGECSVNVNSAVQGTPEVKQQKFFKRPGIKNIPFTIQ